MEYTKEFKKPKNIIKQTEDLLDITISSNLQPQASSTVERKTFTAKHQNNFALPHLLFSKNDSDDSKDNSLGLVNNISNLLDDNKDNKYMNLQSSTIMDNSETETYRARQLLLKCSQEQKNSTLDINKENNANINNQAELQSKDSNSTLVAIHNLSTSVVFEPQEFTARSSEMNKNSSVPSITKSSFPDFSFNATDGSLISKFAEEEFMSGSGMMKQLEADELSWRQNFDAIPIVSRSNAVHSTHMPNTTTSVLPSVNSKDNNRLELSCFSGIIGDVDLTIQSTATGRRVSVGEYFERKCDVLGQLSHTGTTARPNFGLGKITSPERLTKCHALVNPAEITTEAASQIDLESTIADNTVDTVHTTMSLSKIAEVLQTVDGGPRQLVEVLLKQKMKKKHDQTKNHSFVDATAGTYTVLSSRPSLPVVSLSTTMESSQNIADKLSLDIINRMKCDSTVGEMVYKQSKVSLNDINSTQKNLLEFPKPLSSNTFKSFGQPTSTTSVPISPKRKSADHIDLKTIKKSGSAPVSPMASKSKVFNSNEFDGIKIKDELDSSSFYSRFADKITIGKNTQDLYKCTVGTPRDACIDINNDSVRWILCTCKLHQIQGNQDNVEIDVPNDQLLIEPNKSNAAQITVNFLKPSDPIMAALVIEIIDMTSRERFTKQHMMCFIPVESNFNEIFNEKLDDDTCEIDLIDTPMPVVVERNENKYLSLKNISNQIINLTATIVQSDKTQKQHQFTIEPKEIILHSGEVGSLMITYHGSDTTENVYSNHNNNNSNNSSFIDKQAIIKVKTNKNAIYSYSLIGRERQLSDENIDDLRCNTPQKQVGVIVNSMVPLSPQSTTSSHKFDRNSPRSSLSAASSTVADDSIPIKTNHSALVWTTVRVGKHEALEFTIRNTSSNKIKLQGVITDNDNSFKFLKDRDMSTTITILLQHMERKTFTVSFHPNNTGPVAGKITFFHYGKKYDNKESRPSKIIPLYGCGGHVKVRISQALKIMGDQRWLSLGKLNSNGYLNTKMMVENNGDLPAYVKISLTPKAVYPSVEKRWNVDPTELILGPREIQWITIKFRPRPEDISLIRNRDESDMGILTITHGDEPTRWRIRRLYNKMLKEGQIKKKQDESNFKNIVYPLCKVFPGEKSIANINIIRDSIGDLETLCRRINRYVITLIMESNADDTTSIFPDDDDDDDSNESRLFQSLYSDMNNTVIGASENSYLPPVETLTEHQIECDNGHIHEDDGFIVSPLTVTLTPPSIKDTTVIIKSKLSTAQPFETRLTCNEYLSVSPSQGIIHPYRSVLLTIRCQTNINKNVSGILEIYTTHEKHDVSIKVLNNRRH